MDVENRGRLRDPGGQPGDLDSGRRAFHEGSTWRLFGWLSRVPTLLTEVPGIQTQLGYFDGGVEFLL